jgi:hypothetical protein
MELDDLMLEEEADEDDDIAGSKPRLLLVLPTAPAPSVRLFPLAESTRAMPGASVRS